MASTEEALAEVAPNQLALNGNRGEIYTAWNVSKTEFFDIWQKGNKRMEGWLSG